MLARLRGAWGAGVTSPLCAGGPPARTRAANSDACKGQANIVSGQEGRVEIIRSVETEAHGRPSGTTGPGA